MTEQQELFRAPHEESRPKDEIPVKESASVPTGAPREKPKRKHRVSGHNDQGAFVQADLGRVMMLDSILVAVRLEDPFNDKGRYPIEMSLAEYAKGGWTPPEDSERVFEEYDRLSVLTESTMAIERRCQANYHRNHYKKLLVQAIELLQKELNRQ